ncbi:MAG: M20/M25/M40 family metallo-hydrolase [Acidobacteria bacterium]|nr:M20/M25/M40 family metallo-hydrolase [Acidobacteriota bacterium]
MTVKSAALPTATLSARAIGVVFAGEQIGPSEMFGRVARKEPAPGFALSARKTVRLTVATHREPVSTANVVAVLEGSDPVLKHEYVALGAHYDHVGTALRPDAAGDRIYNGADDDGSGTVAILAIAEAMARAGTRPRRSLLFVWHTGEEKGLWGSRYFSNYPTVPIDQIVAQLNIDMIGRSRAPGDSSPANARLTGPDSVYVIGSKLMSSELGALVERVNDRYLEIGYDYTYADPGDPNQFFYRSDHYEYARQGIPIVFYFSGVHEDYHGLDDEVEQIDFRKLRRITQTIHATAWTLANVAVRPKVDTPFGRELLTR